MIYIQELRSVFDHFCDLSRFKSSVRGKKMSLRALAYEEVIHEPCCKNGKLRVKKRARLHAIEEFAAQQLVVLPILTSPTPLSPANIHQTFFMVCSSVQCCFVKSISLVLMTCVFYFLFFFVCVCVCCFCFSRSVLEK